ncbi:MAG: hypothetical protein H8E41_14395 [Desulfobulbaceae bacterium]|uniref:Uncharacterized protein n=1 Tax=Candidatus Desulfobia pelagia TaxID=2841692 RepID=A0A8J6NEC6_9BACT|nr:hypothetical protein [Candidatus Desulfobia pelagia]
MPHSQTSPSCFGYCQCCGQEHFLFSALAEKHCLELMRSLQEKKRIDISASNEDADPHFSTEYLFGQARGKMFGILVCNDQQGSLHLLKAFSGQYNGIWEVDGWAPPLFKTETFLDISQGIEKKIKQLGREIELHPHNSDTKNSLTRERKSLSQNLMKDIHALYAISNFSGETKSLEEIFNGTGIPTGTGDCCAPKLLNYAARNNLTPLSLAEFYWGKENLSGTRRQGQFYESCTDKCQPILGYMLCGM